MVRGRAFGWILVAGLAGAFDARAQESTAIVESEGEANVAVAPDEVRFEFTKSFGGPTLTEGAAQAGVFEKAVTQALSDLDATPIRQEPLRLNIPLVSKQNIVGRILVSYPMPTANAAAGTATKTSLVELAERARKAGVSLLAEVTFAGFDVADRETTEQDAIARASENALYHAEAVGTLLEGRVIGADHITILETTWKGLDPKDGLPIPPAAECFARVRIAYKYSSPAR